MNALILASYSIPDVSRVFFFAEFKARSTLLRVRRKGKVNTEEDVEDEASSEEIIEEKVILEKRSRRDSSIWLIITCHITEVSLIELVRI